MRSFFLLFFVCIIAQAQDATTYVNHRNDKHLCGVFELHELEKDSLYSTWYKDNYAAMEAVDSNAPWASEFESSEVDIYMGTWCGDSKKWVPRFVRLWDDLGLDRAQLRFIALYDSDEKYKQGPNGEEKGKNIHRVPTFIFKEKGEEFARIVESPRNDLITDLKQIATGTASKPNYLAASYFLDLFNRVDTEEVNKNIGKHYNAIYGLVCKSRELNTLGHVYLSAGKINEAILVFYLNTYLFRYEPNVYLNYGIALQANDELEKAKENFSKALELDPEYELAKEKLAALADD